MAAKNLSAFVGGINIIRRFGEGDPLIRGITYDSRRVEPGFLFFALTGLHTDGHRYIDSAVERGALAVVCSRPLERYQQGIVYLQVEDSRFALSPVSAAFYDHPSRRLDAIGVTGTDGKSTTVYLIHQLLEKLGTRSGFVSTVQIMSGRTAEENGYRQSTPESCEIQALLDEMVSNGKQAVVIEATSHGLSRRTNRLGDVRFKVGVLTNITHEHLEFHGTFENYVSDKANLFRALDGERSFGVVNSAEPQSEVFRDAARVPVFSYAIELDADLQARALRPDSGGTSFTLSTPELAIETRINLPGQFNVENVLASVLTVWKQTGAELSTIAELLPGLQPTIGRMHRVRMGQEFEVVVDYAHTPGAFEKLLPTMKAQTAGRLIVVFGSAGERDVAKRSLQGRIASDHCDLIVLTDEDPRGEEPIEILEQIAAGMNHRAPGGDLFLIPDRREAVRKAFALAHPGDVVLLLGKGHEASIIYRDGPVPWNEIEVAEECLSEIGYRRRESVQR